MLKYRVFTFSFDCQSSRIRIFSYVNGINLTFGEGCYAFNKIQFIEEVIRKFSAVSDCSPTSL